MGHLYPQNFSEFVIDELKSSDVPLSFLDLLRKAENLKMEVSCAEGSYDDVYMLEMALDTVLHYHKAEGNLLFIDPQPETAEICSTIREDLALCEIVQQKEIDFLLSSTRYELTEKTRNGAEITHLRYVDL